MCKIITPAELQYRSLPELLTLYRKVERELAHSAPCSEARCKLHASLKNIACAIAHKRRFQPPCP